MSTSWNDDDECSVISDKGKIGFIDFADDKSKQSYDINEEGPFIISVPFPFTQGKPQSILVGQTSKWPITLENTTDDPVELWGVKIFCSNPEDLFTPSLMAPPSADSKSENKQGWDTLLSQSRETLTIWLSCKPKDMGLHTTVVHFDVDDNRIHDTFSKGLVVYSVCKVRR